MLLHTSPSPGSPARPGRIALVGVLAAAVLGALRTRESALRLLEKNRVFLEAGLPALPGPGHLDTLSSWAPPAAGAVFFGLSLGLGTAAILGVAVSAARMLPGRMGRCAPWLVLALPAAAWGYGDPGLALFLLCAAGASLAWARPGRDHRSALLRAAAGAVAVLGLVPWARAPEGAFTRVRDRILLASPSGPGLWVNHLYYRWTLYPAEALKPLDARSQPWVRAELGEPERRSLCRGVLRFGALCADGPPGAADVIAHRARDRILLESDGVRVPWPPDPARQERAWRRLARQADRARPLRRATALALFAGCPLALAWILGGAAVWLGGWVPGQRRRLCSVLVCAGLLGGAVAVAAVPPPWLREARDLAASSRPPPEAAAALLRSPRPVLRLYGVRLASRLGPAGEPWLLSALKDPVINVRYTAALGLGRIGGARARAALLGILHGRGEWYVKERAYAALWRMGWRPGGER